MHYLAKIYNYLTPEAPPDAPMGSWAWPDRRENCPVDEEPTALEVELYVALKQHFSSQHVGLSEQHVDILRSFLVQGLYTSVLHAPPVKTLYRGLYVRSKEDLAALLGVSTESIEEKGAVELQMAIPPKNGFSTSWSAKKFRTEEFSGGDRSRGYAVTLLADVEANPHSWLAGPGGLYDVDGLSRWHLERETIGLEPIVVRKAEYTKLT